MLLLDIFHLHDPKLVIPILLAACGLYIMFQRGASRRRFLLGGFGLAAEPVDACIQNGTITSEAAPQTPNRILIAEDQASIRWVLRRQLERLGHEVDFAEDGYGALAALAHDNYDLLVTDCRMPGMDGIQLAGRIRQAEADEGGKRLPIIGLTADVTVTLRERCLEAGMDDVVAKPVDLHRLDMAIRRIKQVQPVAGEPAAECRSAESLFDPAPYRELFPDADPEGREWLGGFLDAGSMLLDQIRRSAVVDDREALASGAHRLAGAALSAGAMSLGHLCRALETNARRDAPSEISRLVGDLEKVLRATQTEIMRLAETEELSAQ